eukprot:sb/3479138/
MPDSVDWVATLDMSPAVCHAYYFCYDHISLFQDRYKPVLDNIQYKLKCIESTLGPHEMSNNKTLNKTLDGSEIWNNSELEKTNWWADSSANGLFI